MVDAESNGCELLVTSKPSAIDIVTDEYHLVLFVQNTLLKAVDLTIQLMSLHRVLEYGFAPVLCFGYAALVSANALSCAIFILNPFEHSALAEVFVDTM